MQLVHGLPVYVVVLSFSSLQRDDRKRDDRNDRKRDDRK
jgi:hypothetical protein